MTFKKILLPAFIGSAFFLGACGDDAPIAPNNPTPSSAVIIPSLSSSSGITPLPTSSAPVPASSSAASVVVNYPQLATGANSTYALANYTYWKAYHVSSVEQDMALYPSIASEFPLVFSAAFLPASRVIWANQSSGYYKQACSVDDAVDNKFRACTVSEGMGYGMLLAYFNGDDATFNSLWNYTRAFRDYEGTGLMPWITYSFHYSTPDNSSATDADLDIATSLILMYYKTGNAMYLQDALVYVNALWNLEVNPANLLLYSGNTDLWKINDPAYNLSYFSPVAIRLFAMVDPAHNWTGVLNAMYAYMQKVQNAGTGVFPDWSNEAGVAVNPPNNSAANTYWTFNKESVRIPWRIAWDYYWYQDPRAATILAKLNTFISDKAKGDPNDMALAVNYSWNLDVGKDKNNPSVSSEWYAAWCATGIAGNAAWLNTCTMGMNNTVHANGLPLWNSKSSYFSDILFTMYSGLLNGLFVRPAGI